MKINQIIEIINHNNQSIVNQINQKIVYKFEDDECDKQQYRRLFE